MSASESRYNSPVQTPIVIGTATGTNSLTYTISLTGSTTYFDTVALCLTVTSGVSITSAVDSVGNVYEPCMTENWETIWLSTGSLPLIQGSTTITITVNNATNNFAAVVVDIPGFFVSTSQSYTFAASGTSTTATLTTSTLPNVGEFQESLTILMAVPPGGDTGTFSSGSTSLEQLNGGSAGEVIVGYYTQIGNGSFTPVITFGGSVSWSFIVLVLYCPQAGAHNAIPDVPTFSSAIPSIAQMNQLAYAVDFLSNVGVRPYVKAYKESTGVQTQNVWKLPSFGFIAYDNEQGFRTYNGAGQIVIQTQGYYSCEACFQVNTSASTGSVSLGTAFIVTGGGNNPHLASAAQYFFGLREMITSSDANTTDQGLTSCDISPFPLYPGDAISSASCGSVSGGYTTDYNVNTNYISGRFVFSMSVFWTAFGV